MDDHDVDLARLDVGGEQPERGPLRGVPRGATVDDQHLPVAEVGGDGGLHRRAVLGAHDEHEAAYVGQRERVAHRPHQHGDAPQRQQDLVDLGADPAARAGGEDDDGSGHARGLSG